MASQVPQYSYINIVFNNIKYNVSSENVDLTSVSDIILSISKTNPSSDPIAIIKNSSSPSRFTIDNINKKISININPSELTNETGKYFVNLWIQEGSSYITHLQKTIEVQAVPKYSLT